MTHRPTRIPHPCVTIITAPRLLWQLFLRLTACARRKPPAIIPFTSFPCQSLEDFFRFLFADLLSSFALCAASASTNRSPVHFPAELRAYTNLPNNRLLPAPAHTFFVQLDTSIVVVELAKKCPATAPNLRGTALQTRPVSETMASIVDAAVPAPTTTPATASATMCTMAMFRDGVKDSVAAVATAPPIRAAITCRQ